MTDDARSLGPLREWLAYLREAGVRELQAPREPLRPDAAARGRPPAARPRKRPPAAPPPAPAAPQEGGLFEGFDTAPPPDPAQRLTEIREEIGEAIAALV